MQGQGQKVGGEHFGGTRQRSHSSSSCQVRRSGSNSRGEVRRGEEEHVGGARQRIRGRSSSRVCHDSSRGRRAKVGDSSGE